MNINKVVLSGNLVKDMEVITGKEWAIGKFTIANNVGFGDKEHTNFINCTLFGEKRVESLEQYLVKGTAVTLVGELEIKNLKSEDDEYMTFTTVKVDNLEITRFKEKEEEEPKKSKKKYNKK